MHHFASAYTPSPSPPPRFSRAYHPYSAPVLRMTGQHTPPSPPQCPGYPAEVVLPAPTLPPITGTPALAPPLLPRISELDLSPFAPSVAPERPLLPRLVDRPVVAAPVSTPTPMGVVAENAATPEPTPTPTPEARQLAQAICFVTPTLPGTVGMEAKRPRRAPDAIERHYACTHTGCTKRYGTLNHLNAHILGQGHGEKRSPAEFKVLRRTLRQQAKASSSG